MRNKHLDLSDISAYLDAELGNEENRRIEDHLFSCTHCLKEYEDLLLIKEQMKINYANLSGPMGLEEKIITAIKAESLLFSRQHSKNRPIKFLPPAIIIGFIIMLMMGFVPLIASSYHFITAFFYIGMNIFHATALILNKLPIFVGVTIAVLGFIIIGSAWSIIRLLPTRSLFEEETHPSTR